MKCDRCNINEADIYIERYTNGHKETLHLCKECAVKYQQNLLQNDVFESFINSFKSFSPESFAAAKTADKTCPVCGMRYSDFKKNAKLGCAGCYQTFGSELSATFSNIQPGTRHIGKMPKKNGAVFAQDRALQTLKAELQKAVEAEEYERAARLRDEIRGYCLERGDHDGAQ